MATACLKTKKKLEKKEETKFQKHNKVKQGGCQNKNYFKTTLKNILSN